MDELPYIVAYVAIVICAIVCIARFIMFSRMPLHIRWELYPVAHEGKKVHYGGSYLEEKEWWKKPREVSLVSEIKHMAAEILFLVALKEHNPKLWIRSFPFHFGLYLLIGSVVLMLGHGVLLAVAPNLTGGNFITLVQTAIIFISVAGLALGLIGALGLLHRRLTDPELKDFTSPADIFNLVFFIAAFGCSLATFLLVDLDGTIILGFTANLVAFKLTALQGTPLQTILPTISVVLLGLLTAYVPLTHMSHFIGKYFAYHAIRWNDEPNLPGGKQEAEIGKLLALPVSWQAAHIRADGKKSWADVCLDPTKPAEDQKKDKKKK